jgi:hypothetical protein
MYCFLFSQKEFHCKLVFLLNKFIVIVGSWTFCAVFLQSREAKELGLRQQILYQFFNYLFMMSMFCKNQRRKLKFGLYQNVWKLIWKLRCKNKIYPLNCFFFFFFFCRELLNLHIYMVSCLLKFQKT